jgi:hypothetical protein
MSQYLEAWRKRARRKEFPKTQVRFIRLFLEPMKEIRHSGRRDLVREIPF